jgi:hypothetical protein
MRLLRYLGPAVAISVGTGLLIGGVVTHSPLARTTTPR